MNTWLSLFVADYAINVVWTL